MLYDERSVLMPNSGEYFIKTYIPDLYEDKVDIKNGISTDIPNTNGNGIIRFYGIFLANGSQIGHIKYKITFNDPLFVLHDLRIDTEYQRQKYGTILLNESLKDILKCFPYLKEVKVCSTWNALDFYEYNDFTSPYGDNNYVRSVR